MNEKSNDFFMAVALEEAKKGMGQTDPNPMVGAVIVENGEIVAKGYHAKDGEPHAEVEVLKNLGRPPHTEAVMYVTLEPCSTQGRTGACTEVILNAGLKHVAIGAIDPNPAHQGRAIEILKQAGVEVITGILEEECTQLNDVFNKRMKQL